MLGFAAGVKFAGHDDLGAGGVQLHHAAKNRLARQSAHAKLNVCFGPKADIDDPRVVGVLVCSFSG